MKVLYIYGYFLALLLLWSTPLLLVLLLLYVCYKRLVEASNGIQRARNIAYVQAELAIEAVQCLEPSEERDALVSFAAKIVDRTH